MEITVLHVDVEEIEPEDIISSEMKFTSYVKAPVWTLNSKSRVSYNLDRSVVQYVKMEPIEP